MSQIAVVLTCYGKTVGRIVLDASPRLSFPERLGEAFGYILMGEPDIALIDCEITFERINEPVAAHAHYQPSG
jgi:hypothetical protein